MDAAVLTKALVEIAARGETESTALADALGGFLVRVLTGAQILREGPARSLARGIAHSFLAGESLDMVILRATATADTLALGEAGTRKVQRAITATLTSVEVLTPLVARGEGDSALSEGAFEAAARCVVLAIEQEPPPEAARPAAVPAKAAVRGAHPAAAGRYRLIDTVASAPGHAVYRARRPDSGAAVEIHMLTGALGADGALEQELREQATRVAIAASHCPAIATVYECERVEREAVLLAVARPDGPTLRETIDRDGPLDATRALGIAVQIGKALERAHALRMLHGGLRPDNVVLVGPEESVVLIRFGLEWVLEDHTAAARAHGSPHHAAGPSAYLAPEQESGHASEQSDVYALGAILYEMLAGTAPDFSDGRVPASLGAVRSGITPSVEHLVEGALSEAPHRRPGMSVVCSELWLELSPDGQSKLPYRRTVALPRSGRWAKQLATCAAVGALAATTIWFAHGRATSTTRGAPTRAAVAPSTPVAADASAPSISTAARPADVRVPGTSASLAVREELPPPPAALSVRAAERPRATPEPNERVAPPERRVEPVAPAPRSEAPAVTRPQPAPSPQVAPSRETRARGEDPGAIIDWLFNERASRDR